MADGANVRLRVKLDVTQKIGEERLKERYGVTHYDLSSGYTLPESLKSLVPKDVPEFVDPERYVERVMRALYHFKQCALVGPSGTGKTHVVYLVAKIAGLPLWEINCSLQTSVYDLFGRFVGLGKENWVDGLIVSWCRYGGILYLDEANMMKQDIASRLNPLLDTRGHLVLAEKDNEIIPRHKYGYVIISMNPYSIEFAGTKPLNVAFRRRMSVWINFDYLSVGSKISSEEIDLICERTKIQRDLAERIIRAAAELRRRYKSGDLPYAPSVGDLINWATLIADGSPPLVSAEETIVCVSSDDVEVQNSIRAILRMFFGSSK
jgi:MoxR-like ATPase